MSFRDHPDYSPLFDELLCHFLRLPADTFFREYWHSHSKKHLKRFFRRCDFADRAREELGYLVPQIYSEHLRASDYRIRWLVMEDSSEAMDGFARVFDRFNLYTTLNRYPMPYALARIKVMLLEHKLWLARLNSKHPGGAARVDELTDRLELARQNVPQNCHVDLAFDFDAGGEDGGLTALLPSVRKLLDFCETYGVQHQLFFSGGRGFHVVVPHAAFDQPLAEDNHLVNRRVAELIQEETGDLGIDRAIYSNRRQFRLPNTRHQKSGLYKVVLTRSDLEAGEQHVLQLAKSPIPVPPMTEGRCEYLAGLYALAADDVRTQTRFSVKETRREALPAARQSVPTAIGDRRGAARKLATTPLTRLVHPPCITQALQEGIADPEASNRNQVSVLLACYFKTIGRAVDETGELLVRHAVTILAPFSHSSPREIENSTRTAAATVFRHERYRFNCRNARRLGFECNDTCELLASTRETATSRRLHKVPPLESPVPAGEASRKLYSDVDALRHDMAQRVEDYIAEVKSGNHGKRTITPLLVKAPAGCGKTTTVFDKLARMGLRTLWVATRLDLFDNIPESLKPYWRRIEGRHGEATLPSGEKLPANCSFPDQAHFLRERRVNVNERLCRECDYRAGCGYFRQFEDRVSNFFVQQPMYLHKVKDYARQFDVVVFDEDIMAQFVESVRIRERDVRQLFDMLRDLRSDLEDVYNYKEADQLGPLLDFLEGLACMLAETRVTRPISGEVLRQRLAEAHEAIHEGSGREPPPDLAAAVKAIAPSLDKVVDHLHFDPRDPKSIPLQFLNALMPVLRYELFERGETCNLSRLHFQTLRLPEREGEKEGKRRFTNLFEVTFKADPPPLPTPTMILDATGKADIYERLFGTRPLVYAPAMKLKNRVVQIYSTSGSYGALKNAVHRKHMLDLLQTALEKEPCALVICKQGLKGAVEKMLPPEAAITHFYGNRGSNAYQDYKRVVVFGMPGMNPAAILRYAGAFFYADDLTSDTEVQIRRYDGTDAGVKVLVYKEPLIQAVAETAREDEVLQSIHRIRPGLDPDKEILLLTNLVIPELPVADLVSVSDVRGRRRQRRTRDRLAHLVELAQFQVDALGFVSPALTLWPPVRPAGNEDAEEEAYLREAGAWRECGATERLSRPRLYALKDELRQACKLQRFAVMLKWPTGGAAVELWGRSSDCLASARRFFEGHPRWRSGEIEVIEQ